MRRRPTSQLATLSALLLGALVFGVFAFEPGDQPPPGRSGPAMAGGPRDSTAPEAREGSPEDFPGRPAATPFARAMRDLMRIRQKARVISTEQTHIDDLRAKIEKGELTGAELDRATREEQLRTELLVIEKERYVEAARSQADMLEKVLENAETREKEASAKPEDPAAFEERRRHVRELVEYLRQPDADYEGVTRRVRALSEDFEKDGPGGSQSSRRMRRLEVERNTLRFRLGNIEEELMLLRSRFEMPQDRPAPDAISPDMRKPLPGDDDGGPMMYDGRMLPPNHPDQRRGRGQGGAPQRDKAPRPEAPPAPKP